MSRRIFPRLLGPSALAAAAVLALPISLAAQQSSEAIPALSGIGPSVRITGAISNDKLVTLKGNTPPFAQSKYDQGAVAASTATGTVTLMLQRSPAQSAALMTYLGSLQNPNDPSYHKWLTPQTFGTTFGASTADIQTVTRWLQSQGFQIVDVPVSHNLIRFSGTTGQISNAFHTALHTYSVNGVRHIANASDPQIPAALGSVVAGLTALNDVHSKPLHILNGHANISVTPQRQMQASALTNRVKPLLTGTDANGNTILLLTPSDASTIYNAPNTLNSNFKSGSTYTGAGVNIGLVGDSDLSQSDYANFRNLFLGGSTFPSQLNLVQDGTDPGIVQGDSAIEALLDAENASALAPSANIYFYSSADSLIQDGVYNAALRAVLDNNVSVLSVSFGNCEANLGIDGNLVWSTLWQQAAAQGISVMVSTGDSGSAGCDADTETTATDGLGVNGIASTPYNVAVGGTDYDVLATSFSQYVGTQQQQNSFYGSALSYIPENPWNDSISNNPPGTYSTNTAAKYDDGNGGEETILAAGSGGPSTSAYCSTNTFDNQGNCISNLGLPSALSGYPTPPFQSVTTSTSPAFANTPLSGANKVRHIPDVSLFASPGNQHSAAWVLCADSNVDGSSTAFTDCVPDSSGNFSLDGIGGTSASSPAFAGIFALVAQEEGHRLGLANNVLYNLAASKYSTVFHDITVGNNSVPCTGPDCGSNGFINGFNAGTGFDDATGLGSVDISALIAAWQSASFTATSTTLSVAQSSGGALPSSITHGTAVQLSTTVNPSTATGTVAITGPAGSAGSGVAEAIPLINGAGNITVSDLPGGTYNIQAYYPGDTTDAPSTSTSVPLTITPEASQIAFQISAYDVEANQSQQITTSATVPYGLYMFADAQPLNSSGDASHGAATGSVSFLDNGTGFIVGGAISTVALSSSGLASLPLSELAPGPYTISAKYSGDASYQASSTGTIALTVTKAATQLAGQASVNAKQPTTTNVVVTLTTDSVGAFPTGAITLTGNGQTFSNPTVVNGTTNAGTVALQATFTIPNASLSANTSFTATYAGDANYSGSTTTFTASLCSGTGASFCFAPTPAVTIAQPGASGTSTVTLQSVNGFAGAVNLTCSIPFSAAGGTAPTCSIAPASVTLAANGTATATVTINTTALKSALTPNSNDLPLNRVLGEGGGIALGVFLLCGIPARRRSWRSMLVALFAIGMLGVIGCGGFSGGSSNTVGTSAGTYTATVTGTSSGAPQTTTQVSIVVQ